jgi:hypothetical protein
MILKGKVFYQPETGKLVVAYNMTEEEKKELSDFMLSNEGNEIEVEYRNLRSD